jgi:hypothetical protein
MLTLRVDSSLIPGITAPITVDTLLSVVEPVLGQSGRIVTAVRINGVGEPAFRDPDVLARGLADVDAIDLDTTPAGVMASRALEDAVRFLPELAGEACGVADGLRGARAAEHRAAIGGLAENLALLTTLVQAADVWARQAGLAATDWLDDDVAAVHRVAETLEAAAGTEDWVAVADALEYDLTAALDAWQARLSAGRVRIAPLVHAAEA